MTAAKRRFSQILCVFLIVLLAIGALTSPAQAAVPKIKAKVTRKNVLSLAKKYDKDGYYLLTHGDAAGGDRFMSYFTSPLIIQGMDTGVHEMCHACTFVPVYGQEKIYKGDKKFITVNYVDSYFRTQPMASTIPKRFRTFRYKTYVADPMPNLASDVHGIYGLLNEFTAYNWGMHDTVSLFPYYKAKAGANMNYWDTFINNGANDRLAYAEFRYYMLHYLAYAKAKHPKAYKDLMKNAEFKKAFKTIDKKFRANIKAYEKDLKELKKILKKKGHSVSIEDDFFYCDGMGTGLYQKDYNKLMKEMKNGKYKGTRYAAIYKKLMK